MSTVDDDDDAALDDVRRQFRGHRPVRHEEAGDRPVLMEALNIIREIEIEVGGHESPTAKITEKLRSYMARLVGLLPWLYRADSGAGHLDVRYQVTICLDGIMTIVESDTPARHVGTMAATRDILGAVTQIVRTGRRLSEQRLVNRETARFVAEAASHAQPRARQSTSCAVM